jgi:hypothetical protein
MQLPNLASPRLIVAITFTGVVAAVMLAASGAGGSPAKHAGAAASTVTPSCASSGLVVWLNNQAGGGAAGSQFFKLEFTNLSGHACTMLGYPGVSAVNLRGRQLGSAASRNHASKPKVVKLASGQSASAQLQIVNAGNYGSSKCHETTAAGLRVYPPSQTVPKIVPFPFSACARTGPVVLGIEAVKKA